MGFQSLRVCENDMTLGVSNHIVGVSKDSGRNGMRGNVRGLGGTDWDGWKEKRPRRRENGREDGTVTGRKHSGGEEW